MSNISPYLNEDKLVLVFEMLVNRLTNIEIQNNSIINHLKQQCIERKKLPKELFNYPMDVELIDSTPFSFDKSSDEHLYVVWFDGVDEIPSDILKQKYESTLKEEFAETQIEKIINHNQDEDSIRCVDIGKESIFTYVDDHIISTYFTRKNKQCVYVLQDCAGVNAFIFRNIANIDEIFSLVNSFYDDTKTSSLSKMYIKEIHKNWMNFEIISKFEFINYIKLPRLTKKQLKTYLDSICRIKHDSEKTNDPYMDASSITSMKDTLRDLMDELYLNM